MERPVADFSCTTGFNLKKERAIYSHYPCAIKGVPVIVGPDENFVVLVLFFSAASAVLSNPTTPLSSEPTVGSTASASATAHSTVRGWTQAHFIIRIY